MKTRRFHTQQYRCSPSNPLATFTQAVIAGALLVGVLAYVGAFQ